MPQPILANVETIPMATLLTDVGTSSAISRKHILKAGLMRNLAKAARLTFTYIISENVSLTHSLSKTDDVSHVKLNCLCKFIYCVQLGYNLKYNLFCNY